MAKAAALLGIARIKIRISSAYIKWQIGEHLLDLKIGVIEPSLTRLEMFKLRNSSARMKRKGERGSPCLSPLVTRVKVKKMIHWCSPLGNVS